MEPFIGQIIMFGGNFAPRSWAFCDGQLLSIADNQALFSILGTIYGGDGRSTFALPDLRGRAPVHAGSGSGPGLTPRPLGQKSGAETTTLGVTNLPPHNHAATLEGSVKQPIAVADTSRGPLNNYPAKAGTAIYGDTPSPDKFSGDFASDLSVTIGNAGGGQAINNMQPYLAVNYIISLQGVYPSRS